MQILTIFFFFKKRPKFGPPNKAQCGQPHIDYGHGTDTNESPSNRPSAQLQLTKTKKKEQSNGLSFSHMSLTSRILLSDMQYRMTANTTTHLPGRLLLLLLHC